LIGIHEEDDHGHGLIGRAGGQGRLEIIGEDLAWLAADPRVDPKRIAVIGGSRGGELALLVGATYPQVKAIVATVPSGVGFPGLAYPLKAAWTYWGQDIPYLGFYGGQAGYVEENGVTYEDDTPAILHDLDVAPQADLDAATIQAEKLPGPILLPAGEDDRLWPSCVLAKIAYDRLFASGHTATYGDQSECYTGAGHAMASQTGWSTMDTRGYCEGTSCYLLGGTPAGNAHAQRAADTAIRRVSRAEAVRGIHHTRTRLGLRDHLFGYYGDRSRARSCARRLWQNPEVRPAREGPPHSC